MTCRVVSLLVLVGGVATAQGRPTQSMIALLESRWASSCEYTRAIAEQMPEGKYDFRPVREEMTFVEQVSHIAHQNRLILSEIARKNPPNGLAVATSKEGALLRLDQVRDFGFEVLRNVGANAQNQEDVLNGFMLALDHSTHHRGQLVVYLRVNGITPAAYRR
jgi:hypothetical protein